MSSKNCDERVLVLRNPLVLTWSYRKSHSPKYSIQRSIPNSIWQIQGTTMAIDQFSEVLKITQWIHGAAKVGMYLLQCSRCLLLRGRLPSLLPSKYGSQTTSVQQLRICISFAKCLFMICWTTASSRFSKRLCQVCRQFAVPIILSGNHFLFTVDLQPVQTSMLDCYSHCIRLRQSLTTVRSKLHVCAFYDQLINQKWGSCLTRNVENIVHAMLVWIPTPCGK